ncbi:hypothetical protein EHQ43_17465 [Leptospira bouyouniensis]|uniref:Uncharacterized protein n=1 Tax=Leptospira bouyouniensis TaxID=2484911 RepID=A0A7I0HPP5_9LEPT|nr:hypothetical protein [Leptospira bouyouniensis]TGL03544.1 hypothetical protein EHQ43_17465 [Leptospira bouyouniensis]
MKNIYFFSFLILLYSNCADLKSAKELKEENNKLNNSTTLLLLANQILLDYNAGMPINNMQFRFSTIDKQNVVLSLSEYCINVYTIVGLDPSKIVTEWQSLTKYPSKCNINQSVDFKCFSSKNIYINEYILPASLGFTNAENICNSEAKGTILVY